MRRSEPPQQHCSIHLCTAMQPVLEGRRLRGPPPPTPTTKKEEGWGQMVGGRGTCQYDRILTRSTSSMSPTGQSVPFQSPRQRCHLADPSSQVVPKGAAAKKTDAFDIGCHQTSSACEWSEKEAGLEHHPGWRYRSHHQPFSSRVFTSAPPEAAKAATNLSIDGDRKYDHHYNHPHARYSEGLGRSESDAVQEIPTNTRSVLRASNVVASGCSEAILPGTQQWVQSGERFKRESWSSPVRVDPPSPSYKCNESPFFCKELPGHVYSTFKEKADTTSPFLTCHRPTRVATEPHSSVGVDAVKLREGRNSNVPHLCSMHGTTCSSEMLDPAVQPGGDQNLSREETSNSSFASIRRESSGVQGVWPRAMISSTFTSFTRSGCSSVSTATCALSQRQSVDIKGKELDPSVSCSFDLSSFRVAYQTQPSKSISAPVQQASITENHVLRSASCSTAAANAGTLLGSPASGFRNAISPDRVLSNAPENFHNNVAKDKGPAAPSHKLAQVPSRPSPSADCAASTKLLNADVRGFAAAKDVNASDIVLSCGLPSPESSAPVSLACRVIIRRYAAAAATAAEAITRRAAQGTTGKLEEASRGSLVDTHEEESKRRLSCEQFEDCGWAWQEDGGGLLLLRLQRKQLDQGKVKSAGYEAFGREYGLPAGKSVNNFAPWNFLYSQVSTPLQKDAFRTIITDIRRHLASSLSSHVVPSSARGTRVPQHIAAKPDKMQPEERALTTTSLPPLCWRSPSNIISPQAFLKSESCGPGSTTGGKPCGWSLKETAAWGDRGKGGIEDKIFGRGWGLNPQSEVEARSCQCCGDRREKLVCCTRSASLLEAKSVSDRMGSAPVISFAPQQPSCKSVRGRATTLCCREDQLLCQTAKSNKQKYLVSSAASHHSRKRHSTCEGRLEGWHAQQLSVRVILRNVEPPASAPFVREDCGARRRLRKRVTFSVDCLSSEGEKTPGVHCRPSPRLQQDTPLRQPLISRVHSSTYRQASGLLSRSRTDCPPVVAAAAREAADVVGGIREEKRRNTGPLAQMEGRKDAGRSADIMPSPETRRGLCCSSSTGARGSQHVGCCASATDVPSKNAIVREESFYIVVGCRRPAAASRWTRRGRTVVSRNCTRYVGPLLPLVVSLLERERESVRVRYVDKKGQAKDEGPSKTQQVTKESPFPWLRKPNTTAESRQQQHQLKHPHQQRQQMLLQRQEPKEPQQRVPQQRQSAPPCVQRSHQPQQQQHMRTKQQGQQNFRQQQHVSRSEEKKHAEGTAVRTPATGEIARILPRQGWQQRRNEEQNNDGCGGPQREFILYQPPRTPWSHVCPRYYHPLDTPETLFPQARARQLRRLLMLQNASGFPAVDNPLVLTNGLPLLQGGAAAAGALGKGNLAAYPQLGRCNVAARAVAMAAATRRPAIPPQLSSTLRHQHSQRERFISSPYSLPEYNTTPQGHLFHASAGVGGSSGSPGIWYRRGGLGPVGPPRHAASCSFAFDHSSTERGYDVEDTRLFRRRSTRQFERGFVEEDDDEDDDEEEYPRKRLPRFFRLRRSSDVTGQGGTEEHSRLSRFSSRGRIQQHGRNGESKITTSEKLKRLLVPLFMRGFYSAADNSQGQAEGQKEEQDSEEAAADSSKESESPSEQAADLAEDDNEDLWVTESDASTPPLSQASIIIVRKKRPEVSKQQGEKTAARIGKGGTHKMVSRKSATASQVPVLSQQERERETSEQFKLSQRQSQTHELINVVEEPNNKWQTQEKENCTINLHRSGEKQTADPQRLDEENDIVKSESKPKESSCGSGGEIVQQQSERSSDLHEQQSQKQLRRQQPDDDEMKLVEASDCQLQPCVRETDVARPQMKGLGENENNKQHYLQQAAPVAKEKISSAELLRPLHEEPLLEQVQHAEEQQQSKRSLQQMQQQQAELLPAAGELLRQESKPEHQVQTQQEQNRSTTSSRGRHRLRAEEKEDLSNRVVELKGMQKKEEEEMIKTEALAVDDDGSVFDADKEPIPQKSPIPKQQTFGVNTNEKLARQAAETSVSKQEGTETRSDVQTVPVAHLNWPQDLNHICVLEEKAVQQACASQSPLEEKPSALAIKCGPKGTEQKTSVEDSSSNEERWKLDSNAHHAAVKRDGLESVKGVTCHTTLQDVDAIGLEKEEEDGRNYEKGRGLETCFTSSCTVPVPAYYPAAVSALTEEEVPADAAAVKNAPVASLLTRRGLLPSSLRSAEAKSTCTQDSTKYRTGGGLRWHWKRSTRVKDQKGVDGEDILSSSALAQAGFPRLAGSPDSVAVFTTAVTAAPTSPKAAVSAAATLTLCNDDQVASSTAEGSQQTVSSPLHRGRESSKKSSFLAAFDQFPAPWSTRSIHGNREESRNLPTLLQRLSTRFRRRRDFDTNKSSEEGIAQCTPDTDERVE